MFEREWAVAMMREAALVQARSAEGAGPDAVARVGGSEAVSEFVEASRLSELTPRLLAAFTFLSGGVLLFSGATPAAEGRLALLNRIIPLGVIETSHFLGSLVGAALLLLSQGLARRLDADREPTSSPPSPPASNRRRSPVPGKPAATAAPAPPEEPPGVRPRFQGLRVMPQSGLSVKLECANSGVAVLPIRIAPAARRRCQITGSKSGTQCS